MADPLLYIDSNIKVLRLWGMWPSDKINSSTVSRLMYSVYTCFVLFMEVFYLSGHMIHIISGWGDISAVSEGLFMALTLFSMKYKLLNMILRRRSINALTDTLTCQEFLPQEAEHEALLQKAIHAARTNTYFYFIFCVVTCFGILLNPLLSTGRSFPQAIDYPYVDVFSSPAYEILYVMEVYCLFGAACMNMSMDTIMPGYMAQAVGQLDCLVYNLTNIVRRSEEHVIRQYDTLELEHQKSTNIITMDKDVITEIVFRKEVDKELLRQLKACIVQQELITKYVEDIEELFNKSIFLQFLLSGIIICTSGFHVVLVDPVSQPFQFVTVIGFFVCMLTEVFMLCWFGNEITEKSSEITNAVYDSAWPDCSEQFKKALITIMERAKRPLTVTAAKMFICSLDTFKRLMNTSFSYFALLRQMSN